MGCGRLRTRFERDAGAGCKDQRLPTRQHRPGKQAALREIMTEVERPAAPPDGTTDLYQPRNASTRRRARSCLILPPRARLAGRLSYCGRRTRSASAVGRRSGYRSDHPRLSGWRPPTSPHRPMGGALCGSIRRRDAEPDEPRDDCTAVSTHSLGMQRLTF